MAHEATVSYIPGIGFIKRTNSNDRRDSINRLDVPDLVRTSRSSHNRSRKSQLMEDDMSDSDSSFYEAEASRRRTCRAASCVTGIGIVPGTSSPTSSPPNVSRRVSSIALSNPSCLQVPAMSRRRSSQLRPSMETVREEDYMSYF